MARFALILSILIGLGAAFLGYKATEQAKALQNDLGTAKSERDTAKTTLKKKEGELAEAKMAQATAEEAQKKAEADLTKAQSDLTAAVAAKKTAEDSLGEATTKLATAQKDLEDLTAQLKEFGGTPAEIKAKLTELTESKTKLELEVAESKQVQASLQKKADDAEGKVAGLQRQIDEYKGGYVRNGLQGKVLAYNPGWNFVVVNLGDKAGLKSGVQMVVTRSGAMVGKIKVTTVEPSTAIADVLPGTLARGDSVQPGDTVIYQGDR
jgi:multidrug efflux pump subunit AcrA (membrane-fusion protein)